MKSSRLLSAATAVLVLYPLMIGTARAQMVAGADRQRLFSSDTLEVGNGASLSPDGRWLALSLLDNPRTASLWLQPAKGGALRRVTPAGKWDAQPQWSPDNKRIFFLSSRPARAGDQNYYVMMIPVDPKTGRAAGEARQVTADPVTAWRISPDGRQVAYIEAKDRRLLKVIPANGGKARVVTNLPLGTVQLSWSLDGKSIAFLTNQLGEGTRVIRRVALSGGEPVVIAKDIPSNFPMVISPGGEQWIEMDNSDPRARTLHVKRSDGRVVKSVSVKRNTRALGFTRDGRSFLALEDNISAPTRVMAVTGGAYREITSTPDYYDWVAGWAADGSRVYVWTEHNRQPMLAAVPANANGKSSGITTVFTPDKQWNAEGVNSRYVFAGSSRAGRHRTLVAVDLRDNARHVITETAPMQLFPTGPGGTWGMQENLLYLERQGDRLDVKEWSGPGRARLIRSLPGSVLNRSTIGVHGNRVAWLQPRGDSLDLMIAEGVDGEPRRLFAMSVAPGQNEIAFSHDGSMIALHYARRPATSDGLMAIVDVSGRTPPRIIDTGMSYWYWSRWLPDNSAVLVIGGGAGTEADVVMVPIREDAKPVVITRDDPSSMWGFELSPDGRFIAYPGEISRGASVWKIAIQ